MRAGTGRLKLLELCPHLLDTLEDEPEYSRFLFLFGSPEKEDTYEMDGLGICYLDMAYVTRQVSTDDAMVDATALPNEPDKLCNGTGMDGENAKKEEEKALAFLSFFSLWAANLQ